MVTMEQIKQAEAELQQVEQALEKARAGLADAIAEKEHNGKFWNAFVERRNRHKEHFKYLADKDLGDWAVKDHALELEQNALIRRSREIDMRCEKWREEVRLTEASRVARTRELELTKMPDGKAWHIRVQEGRLRGS